MPHQKNTTFTRNNTTRLSDSSTKSSGMQNCRRKLQESFDETDNENRNGIADRSVLSVLTLDETRRVLRNGVERISKTFNSVRTTFGSISQKFRSSTKRRQILEEGPMTPNAGLTPYTFSKQILGRTPTKLYSPFGIESPYGPTTYNKENYPNQALNNKR